MLEMLKWCLYIAFRQCDSYNQGKPQQVEKLKG